VGSGLRVLFLQLFWMFKNDEMINTCMDQQQNGKTNVACPNSGILFSHKKERTTDTCYK
jgi:hypothetical protein